jgi:hypothetical protein
MSSTRKALLGEGQGVGSKASLDFEGLDVHLPILNTPKTGLPKRRASNLDTERDIYPPHRASPSSSKSTPRTESEIIVRIDGMEYDAHSLTSRQASQDDLE